jgi:hypothetical protein
LAQDIAPAPVKVGQPTTFGVDTKILVADGFRWVWPDGSVSEGSSSTYTFATPGSYVIKLQAKASQPTFSEIDTILVAAIPKDDYMMPAAKISVRQTAVNATSHTVQFDAEVAGDPSTSAKAIEWKFGDGEVATGKSVRHTYQGSEWIFYPKVRVIDGNGIYQDFSIQVQASKMAISASDIPGAAPALGTVSSDSGQSTSPLVWLLAGGGLVLLGATILIKARKASRGAHEK